MSILEKALEERSKSGLPVKLKDIAAEVVKKGDVSVPEMYDWHFTPVDIDCETRETIPPPLLWFPAAPDFKKEESMVYEVLNKLLR